MVATSNHTMVSYGLSEDQEMEMMTFYHLDLDFCSQVLLSPRCQSAFQRNSCFLMSVQPGLTPSLYHYPAMPLNVALNLHGPIPGLKCSHFMTWQTQHVLVICMKQQQLCRRKWSKHLLFKITFL